MMTKKKRLQRLELRVQALQPPESNYEIAIREIPILKAWLAEHNLTAQEALDRGETGPPGVHLEALEAMAQASACLAAFSENR